ncbi:MAG: hypothetical protein RR063_12500, partial [Anaerovoracaceae bacterium]
MKEDKTALRNFCVHFAYLLWNDFIVPELFVAKLYVILHICFRALNFCSRHFLFWRCWMTDCTYMKLALELAERGCGWVAPNPLVGAVIVKDGNIIGRGWHQQYGELHAERNALADCNKAANGATM